MTWARQIGIGGRQLGEGLPVYVIAEAGVNHNGRLDLGMQLVDAAAGSGADCVKFQSFRTERLATRRVPKARYHIETTGAEQSWFDLLKSQEMDREMHMALIERCRERGITFLSTPYDTESADLLEQLGVPAFKIASTDSNNIPFLRYVARKRRPMILSTAMCTLDEVRDSVSAIAAEGLRELVVLHCTGNYPAPVENVHMRAMSLMRETLGLPVGYSDHTEGELSAVLATGLGASAYEVHFTLDRSLPGPDHRMSLTPEELRRRVAVIRDAERALGRPEKAVQPSEADNRRILRKSIVAARDLRRGERLTASDLDIKRPGTGIAPARFEAILGRRLARDVPADEVLTDEALEEPGA
jgi:N,N'-diacetyllegionaminate synthase